LNKRLRRAVAAAAISLLCAAAAAKQPGEEAPDFSRADLAGRPLHLADYRGKLILLNFWASWCGPCLAEMPRFSRWQRTYGANGLQVIGVSMDDDSAPVRALLQRQPVAYPIALGDAKLGDLYGGVMGLPLTYLIGPDGRILARYAGDGDLAAMERMIASSIRRYHLRGFGDDAGRFPR
jgi:cytochrome c biogenesis protein CcmG/thiol:disulfide interchange protein DsbE